MSDTNISQRAAEMTGHTNDLGEAFDQWEQERQALNDFMEENKTLTASVKSITHLLVLAEQIINGVNTEAAMFIKNPTRNKINEFQDQYSKFMAESGK